MSKIDQFLNVDDIARDRTAVVSAVVGFVCFLAARVAFGLGGSTSGILTIAVMASIYLYRLWVYCHAPVRRTVSVVGPASLSERRKLVMAAGSGVALLILRFFPKQFVEAAVIDRKLRNLSGQDASPDLLRDAAQLMRVAERDSVEIDRGLTSETAARASVAAQETTMSPAVVSNGNSSVQKSVPIEVTRDPRSGEIHILGKVEVDIGPGFVAQKSPLTFRAGPVVVGPDVAKWGEIGKPDDAASQIFGYSFVMLETRPDTILQIDGLILKNFFFRGFTIRYLGGQTALAGVRFIECNFDFAPLANTIALSAIIAKGEMVDFSTVAT